MLEKFIYIGEREAANNEKLLSCVIPLSDVLDQRKIQLFDKFKVGRFGIGQIITAKITNNGNSYAFSPTDDYVDNKDFIDEMRMKSFLENKSFLHHKELKKLAIDSTKIDDMTIKEVINTSDWRTRKAIIAYLLEKMG
ncbi:MAG: hypothetical protein PHR06_16320 [Candidatus Cloacimonetes bacterium]|nr:hypothetical protein [Candidatus Cloacimonadota bacterium]